MVKKSPQRRLDWLRSGIKGLSRLLMTIISLTSTCSQRIFVVSANMRTLLLITLLAVVFIMPVLATAGWLPCHGHHGSCQNHAHKCASCCGDKLLSLSENSPTITLDKQASFKQLHILPPETLIAADIFQPPRF
jgi:hypothetical protein